MEEVSEKLFNILKTKFNNTDIKTLTDVGKETMDMEEVKMFSFQFIVESRDYGPVVVLLSVDDNLEVYYGDNTSRSLESTAKRKWENLIEHLSVFARRNRYGFSLKHTTDLRYDLSNITDITESYKTIFEGYYGTKKTSYNPQGNARIIIKHSKNLGEDDKRFRYISTLFVENCEGERFKLPFTKLTGARAMARHVTEGGNPYDLFGIHICEMVKDINTLGGFVRRSKMFEDDDETGGLVETGRSHYSSLRKGLKQIAGKRGYHKFKESWEPSAITEQDTDTDAIRKLFTERSINQRVEEALPLLARLQQLAEKNTPDLEPIIEEEPIEEENEMQEIAEFEEWAENIIESEPVGISPDSIKSKLMQLSTMLTSALTNGEFKIRDLISDTDTALDATWITMRDINILRDVVDDVANMLGMDEDDIDYHFKDITHEIYKMLNTMDEVNEGTWSLPDDNKKLQDLKNFMAKEQPVGIDAMNVKDALQNIVGDDTVFDKLSQVAARNPESDARPIVKQWLQQRMPELGNKINMQQEGCNQDLDADSTQQLDASVNKSVDTYVHKPKQTGDITEMEKLFREYVQEAEEALADETVAEDEEIEESEDAVTEEVVDEVVEEDTVEVAEAHDGPIVTMENSNDLSDLMQRTNHLLKR